MDTFTNLVSWKSTALASLVYFASLAFYRLYLHPLARFPGPKLAALTRHYEAYYDVIQNGQYVFKIAEMHKIYGTPLPTSSIVTRNNPKVCTLTTNQGPVIRISPYELHINDPTFFDTLYQQNAHFDKYAWAVDGFAAFGATLLTPSHDLHRARRAPLNPFFSKAKVSSRQAIIHSNLNRLSSRITHFAKARKGFDLGAAIAAYVRDISNEFILGKSYDNLGKDDFAVALVATSQGAGSMWRLGKHVNWTSRLLQAVPPKWMMKVGSPELKVFFRHVEENRRDTQALMTSAADSSNRGTERNTVIDAILNSKLPAHEKSFMRVFVDVSTITGAGSETTASVLRLVLFHIYNQPSILQRLRTELASARQKDGVSDTQMQIPDLKTLEQLSYLTAVLKEGMRFSPAIAARMERVAKSDLVYSESVIGDVNENGERKGKSKGTWRIPAGTRVGMALILMHMDAKYFPEPRAFKPERWHDAETRVRAERAYAPFSKGTRNCLVMHLAWAEMYVCIAAIVLQFEFRFDRGTAKDFECDSDQFAIGTRGKGVLHAVALAREG